MAKLTERTSEILWSKKRKKYLQHSLWFRFLLSGYAYEHVTFFRHKGVVVDTFLGSLVQSRCGEGGTLQTNNTDVCSQCLSHTGPAPTHGTCALPAHTAQDLGCSARNRPRLALGCVHLPGLSRSGSGTWVVLIGADKVGPAFCALPRSEQLWWPGVWWAQSLRLIASLVPAVRFSGCTTGAPSQVDVDRPEPQEVLVSKEASLQFGR